MVKGGGQLGDKGEKAVLLAVTEFYTRPLRRGAHAVFQLEPRRRTARIQTPAVCLQPVTQPL